ncbi:hypothetical protein GQ600_8116 [Phytophthora cactorum]|nr:hypothetical protein GQ600_8116 [Phytophthora cactorum]
MSFCSVYTKHTAGDQHHVHTKATDDGEARAFSPSISEGLRNWMTRAVWTLSPTVDKLDDGLSGIVRNQPETTCRISCNDRKSAEPGLITTLINLYGDHILAKYLFDVKHDVEFTAKKIKGDAAFLQGAQYVKWFEEVVTPNKGRTLLDLRPKTWHTNLY